jgi:glucose/arabinose dehydrogenase
VKKVLLGLLILFVVIIAGLGITFYISEAPKKDNLTEAEKVGPSPTLPKPEHNFLPTVKIAKAIGWPKGVTPVAAAGLKVNAFASGLDHPRWIYTLPNGDVLVAESNAPRNGRSTKRLSVEAKVKNYVAKQLKQRAGAGASSANKIILLRDTTGNGVANVRTVFLNHLHSPFGMTLVGHYFYVANADAIVRYPYKTGQTVIKAAGVKITDLMGTTTLNHHWTKSLLASRDGKYIYVGVGSNSNIGESGFDQEVGRAAIWQINRRTGRHTIFASGLRNPVGLAWNPQTKALWTVVNERDELGNNLVPDYITSVQAGAFYGWPYSYYGQHVDVRVQPQRPDLVAKAISPDYALGSHVAALGLTFYTDHLLPKQYHNGAFIGEHGSWNRNPVTGYKVVFLKFVNGKPVGLPHDILTGFLSPNGDAYGRPVGVTTDKHGALLVADDVGNKIWRITPQK